ncbi:D-alanyl-D-alanine carboxypeptidase/D-alanyl-D-alanine endopeptidase [Sphingobacterium hungaricum]
MRIYTLITSCLFSVFIASSAMAQTATQKIATAFQTFEKQSNIKNGVASLTVLDAKTGQVVFEKNSQIGLPTASTMKVITSITALDLLGPEFKFQTKLYYTGDIDSVGNLVGDIVIEGSGDPTLASDRFEGNSEEVLLSTWVKAIQYAGIKSVSGRIIGDDRYLNGYDIPGTWMWQDMGNYYGAGVSGLNWRENKTGIVFAASSVNNPTRISKTTSDISYLSVINEVKTGSSGSGDNVYGYSAPYSGTIYLRGTYGQDLKKTIEISVPDPAYDAAFQLRQALLANDILIEQLPTTGKLLADSNKTFPTGKKELHVHSSPKLSEIVYWFNQKSINLYGESLLKVIGERSPTASTRNNATQLVNKYWQQKLGISDSELVLYDGSGLSPQNRVTTSAMSKIMRYAKQRNWFDTFEKSLPTPNNMKMKSGTIGGVLGYTGYQTSGANQDYVFSFLINNYQGSASSMRQAMFKVLDTLK